MLKNSVLKAGNWPISKSELINKNLKQIHLLYKLKGLGKVKLLKQRVLNEPLKQKCIITLACSIA
jgi:hypothetical protein